MRAKTCSRPISSRVASIDGVCASPVTITRSGIAIFGILTLWATATYFTASLIVWRFHSMPAKRDRKSLSAGLMSAL